MVRGQVSQRQRHSGGAAAAGNHESVLLQGKIKNVHALHYIFVCCTYLCK